MKATVIAVAVMMASGAASATSKDCGCTKTPTAYDKTQDVKISGNTSAIGDVKLTAGQAFDIAVEGRATADNALTTVYGLIPQVNNNSKGIADLEESKVDKSVFTADQQRQDKALAATVTTQSGIDAKQSVDLKGYADKKADSAYSTSVAHTDAKVARADADRKAGDDALGARITAVVATQSTRDVGQDEHINAVQGAAQSANEKADAGAVRADGIERNLANTDSRSINNAVRLDGAEAGIRETNSQVEANRKAGEAADKGLSARIDTKVDAGVFSQHSTVVDNRFADTQQRIDDNKAQQSKVNKAVASTLDNHEQRLSAVEQNTNSKFANIDKRLDKVKDQASAGTASAFAQANIPQVMAEGEFGIGAGVGTYSGQNAVAVGASYAPRENLVFKATVSTDSQHNFGAGAGVMVSFR